MSWGPTSTEKLSPPPFPDRLSVERKEMAILSILRECTDPLGARVISRQLQELGVDLGERAVRYHLKIMDERGLIRSVGRDGRLITEEGLEELGDALAYDKVGFILEKIETLAFATTIDPSTASGNVVMNVSFIPKERFAEAVQAMRPVFEAGLHNSDLVAVAEAGQRIGDVMVSEGNIGFGTVCSVTINGAMLKAGIPMDSRFGGILQMRGGAPVRFVQIIDYGGSSLDPTEIFLRAGMTSVTSVVGSGHGKILVNYREIPGPCVPRAREAVEALGSIGIGGVLILGQPSEPVCGIPVGLNRAGMALLGGMNPIAAVEEMGIQTHNQAMVTMMEFQDLVRFWDL